MHGHGRTKWQSPNTDLILTYPPPLHSLCHQNTHTHIYALAHTHTHNPTHTHTHTHTNTHTQIGLSIHSSFLRTTQDSSEINLSQRVTSNFVTNFKRAR